MLILAGPHAGKSVTVVMPAWRCIRAPSCATSIKHEIAERAAPARRELGECWICARPPGRWRRLGRRHELGQLNLADAPAICLLPRDQHPAALSTRSRPL